MKKNLNLEPLESVQCTLCSNEIEAAYYPPIKRQTFYFLRHGETDLNLARKHQGQQDAPLNETGQEQAAKAALLLSNYFIKAIYSSPLLRAKQTAEVIASKIARPVYYLEDLKERFKGEAEGQPYEKCNFPGTYSHITEEEPLGGESTKAFLTRTIRAINYALQNEAEILIVAHGGTLCCLSTFMGLKLTDEIERANSLPLLFEPISNGWSLEVIT